MSFLAPSPPAVTPAVKTTSAADLAEARRKDRLALRLREGRAATILTGGAGLAGPANVTRKKLLGE